MVRFIDTLIWDEDWFCDLGAEYQIFWNYITCGCNNAGIWKPNKIDFEIKSRVKINMVAFLEKINERGCKERIFTTETGRWFLTGFIMFQWFNKKNSFDLILTNKLHLHIYNILKKENIPLKKVRGLGEVLETPKVILNTVDDINSIKKPIRGLGEVLKDNLVNEKFLIPQMMKEWKKKFAGYPEEKKTDFTALLSIAKFISAQQNIDCDIGVLPLFNQLINHISTHDFYRSYSLLQVSRNIQSIVISINNKEDGRTKNTGKDFKRTPAGAVSGTGGY